jgi:thymidylate kinase
MLDLVVFIYVATEIRLARLRARELRRYGSDAVAVGGAMHRDVEEFIEWASHYDDGSREGRNLARHQAWLAKLPCRVIRLDGTRPIPELVKEVCQTTQRYDSGSE